MSQWPPASAELSISIRFLGKCLQVMPTIAEKLEAECGSKFIRQTVKQSGSILESFIESKMRGTLDQICRKPCGRIRMAFLKSRKWTNSTSTETSGVVSDDVSSVCSSEADAEASRTTSPFGSSVCSVTSSSSLSLESCFSLTASNVSLSHSFVSSVTSVTSSKSSATSSKCTTPVNDGIYSNLIYRSFVESSQKGPLNQIAKKPSGRIHQSFLHNNSPNFRSPASETSNTCSNFEISRRPLSPSGGSTSGDSCSLHSSDSDTSRIYLSFVQSRKRGTLDQICKSPGGRIFQSFLDSCKDSSPHSAQESTRPTVKLKESQQVTPHLHITKCKSAVDSFKTSEQIPSYRHGRLPFLLRLPLMKFPKLICWTLDTISEVLEDNSFVT